MAISASRVTASTSAVALNTATTSEQILLIKNTSANPADLGPSTVAATTGFDLAAGATVTVWLDAGDVIYAIRSGASDATIAVFRNF